MRLIIAWLCSVNFLWWTCAFIMCLMQSPPTGRCLPGWHLRRWCILTGLHVGLAASGILKSLTQELRVRALSNASIRSIGLAACGMIHHQLVCRCDRPHRKCTIYQAGKRANVL